jgi:predicted metalloendopeptidase
MDASVSPGDDFYHYASRTWLKNTEIPADLASYDVVDILGEQSQQRTKGLLEAAAAGNAAAGSDERQIGDYFAAYVDEETIEKRSYRTHSVTVLTLAKIPAPATTATRTRRFAIST